MPPKKEHLAPNTQSQKSDRRQKQISQKSVDSRAKAPGDASKLPAGDMPDRKPEGKQEPVLLVAGQKSKVVDVRAQAMTLTLPTTTTKKQSKEILISKTQEITLETLKARGKVEDRGHKTKEETTVNLPNLKSKEIGMQKKWVTTHEMAVEAPPTEDKRAFSVEGLALAKMMIMANSTQDHLKSATISLPSWFSLTSRGSAMSTLPDLPFQSSQMILPDGGQVEVREQSTSQIKEKENTQPQVEETPEDLLRTSKRPTSELPKTVSDDAKVQESSQFAVPAAAADLKDEHQPLASLKSPKNKTESTVRVPQKQGLKKMRTQQQQAAAAAAAAAARGCRRVKVRSSLSRRLGD
ncbi:Putative uncharacterized protein DKFZp434G1729 [Cricetulus griseus]|uniref:Uncharacterized protein n=1 Tax=Cricetulus griseus TaxID=10029 RepID=G3HYH4_CRIGR|nr:Putative uncharacterized protein DKFZp434G1729 [Cricetulus griseus]